MAVLSALLFFCVTFLVAIDMMKVIWDICVMILINFWIILFDVYRGHLCSSKKNFIILFVYNKMCGKKLEVTAVTVLNTAFYIILLHILFTILAIVVMFTLMFHFYWHKQNRKCINVVLWCNNLSLYWKLDQTCVHLGIYLLV